MTRTVLFTACAFAALVSACGAEGGAVDHADAGVSREPERDADAGQSPSEQEASVPVRVAPGAPRACAGESAQPLALDEGYVAQLAVTDDGIAYVARAGFGPALVRIQNRAVTTFVESFESSSYRFDMDVEVGPDGLPRVVHERFFAKLTDHGIESLTLAEGEWQELALDAEGNPHVAYLADDTLHYATLGPSGTFVSEVVRLSRDVYGGVAIAIDAQGAPHLALRTGEIIAHWTKRDGVWEFERSPTAADTQPSLALDAAGQVHIVYGNLEGLVHWWAGTKRHEVVTSSFAFRELELAVDDAGGLHVAARDDARYVYLTNRSGVWSLYGVAGAGVVGEDRPTTVDIDVDASGRVHYLYSSAFINADGIFVRTMTNYQTFCPE